MSLLLIARADFPHSRDSPERIAEGELIVFDILRISRRTISALNYLEPERDVLYISWSGISRKISKKCGGTFVRSVADNTVAQNRKSNGFAQTWGGLGSHIDECFSRLK